MEFVYSVNEGIVRWGDGTSVTMHLNDIWFGDDPFVVGRPDLFSATPLIVHSTEGRDAPPPTPVMPAAVAFAAGGIIFDGGEVTVPAGTEVRRGRGRRA